MRNFIIGTHGPVIMIMPFSDNSVYTGISPCILIMLGDPTPFTPMATGFLPDGHWRKWEKIGQTWAKRGKNVRPGFSRTQGPWTVGGGGWFNPKNPVLPQISILGLGFFGFLGFYCNATLVELN